MLGVQHNLLKTMILDNQVLNYLNILIVSMDRTVYFSGLIIHYTVQLTGMVYVGNVYNVH
jgi:hypothetical protein